MAKSIQSSNGENPSFKKAVAIFRRQGGVLRTVEAVRLGVHPRTLYAMRDAGVLEQLSRGLYRLADLPPLGMPDLVAVAKRVPSSVICLISALSFHEITTQIPHEVYVALQRGAETPRLEFPPVRVFWFGGRAYTEGVQVHVVDGVDIKVYNPAKTVADCFKFRSRIGLDTALESLKLYLKQGGSVDDLLQFAEVCRVVAVIRPYVEAVL